ncbi:hypothetical protein HDV00_011029 [Rhizophlyctis rosea]|nr:hypothetical protein HDV00_011029 [Rhizophlyctis rosea]
MDGKELNPFTMLPFPNIQEPSILQRTILDSANPLSDVKTFLKTGHKHNINACQFAPSPLHMSIVKRNLDLTAFLLSLKADANVLHNGLSPLHLAVQQQDLELAALLLSKGANPNIVKQGLTPIHIAVQLQDLPLTTLLLTHNANPNILDNGLSPLHVAVQLQDLPITSLLLSHKADPDILHNGVCPLHLSVQLQNLPIGALLISYNANPNLLHDGTSPLHVASRLGLVELTKALLGSPAVDVNSEKNGDGTALRVVNELLEDIENGSLTVEDGIIVRRWKEIKELLVAAGADLEAGAARIKTPVPTKKVVESKADIEDALVRAASGGGGDDQATDGQEVKHQAAIQKKLEKSAVMQASVPSAIEQAEDWSAKTTSGPQGGSHEVPVEVEVISKNTDDPPSEATPGKKQKEPKKFKKFVKKLLTVF